MNDVTSRGERERTRFVFCVSLSLRRVVATAKLVDELGF